jgi:hypothetical protein
MVGDEQVGASSSSSSSGSRSQQIVELMAMNDVESLQCIRRSKNFRFECGPSAR